MYKFIKHKYLFVILYTLFGALSPCFCKNQEHIIPAAHILMPAYNANKFILSAIESVLKQKHSNLKLLIFNDGSTDETFTTVKTLLQHNPMLKNKIYLKSIDNNKGVSNARTMLIKWSKNIEPQAYIFWLDADDQYTNKFFIRDAIKQMQKTNADICLANFSIIYENEAQKNNSKDIVKDQQKIAKIIKTILSTPNQSVDPMKLPELLEITSLGWVKCYAPTVQLPQPLNFPFEDFVYMAALLEVNNITALPAKNKPIQYLRRSNSVCGQRKSNNFINDIPYQLKKFFDTVLERSMHQQHQLQKLQMAKSFVSKKLTQYLKLLEKIVKAKHNPEINQNTLNIYRQKIQYLEKYINEQISIITKKSR